jgi:uncharacterized protein
MKILISHISEDTRFFDFTTEKEGFDIPELTEDVRVHVSAFRSRGSFTFKGMVCTAYRLECDRCLDPYTQKVEEPLELIVSTDPETEQDDDIVLLNPHDVEIDLRSYVRETLLLAVPFKKLCSPACKGLCVRCGANMNRESCSCKHDERDPRWEKLNELKKTLESAEE